MLASDHRDSLFRLRPSVAHRIYCGQIIDKRQFILGGKDASTACLVLFDANGNYLEWKNQFVSSAALSELPPANALSSLEDWACEVEKQYERLVTSIGAQLGPICVHAFAVPDADFDMSIMDAPWYLRNLLDDPTGQEGELGAEEYQRLLRILAEWKERGDFVLTWGGDYHVDRSGEIVFS